MITAKIKSGILLCCLPMRFSLVFFMSQIVFNVFSIMFAETSLLSSFVVLVFDYSLRIMFLPLRMVLMQTFDAIIRASNYVRL